MLFLPLAHAFARIIQATLVHSADLAGMQDQLRRHRPTFILAVPRVFEKMHGQAQQTAAEARRGRLFTGADRVAAGRRWVTAWRTSSAARGSPSWRATD